VLTMWSPTHVEVTVSRARNLKAKGKSGTNDAYVSIKLGKEKFQTTLRERAKDPEWHEQCQFLLSEEHKTVKLKVFHRNLIGKDDFLGYAEIQLDPSLVYERPQSRWYNLGNKPGDKGPARNRGEIEVFVTYVVQSISGSHMSLNMTAKGRKLSAFKGIAHQFGDKLSLKGSLKRSPSQKSDNKFESGLEQSSRTLPSYHRRAVESAESREDERAAGLLEEVDEAEVDHQTLKDKKPPASRSSVFKFPFLSKNKQLQKMSLLSQSTLGLPSTKSTAAEFGHMRDVTNPPSESSSGFESRRVSTSESQASSSCDSSAQVKESDDFVTAVDTTPAPQDIKQGSSEGILSWKTGDSEELKRELQEKEEHEVCDTMVSIRAEESSVAEEIGAFDLGEQDYLQDVQKGFYSVGGNKKIPESPEEIHAEIGITRTAAEMISLTSDRNDMEEKIQQQENFPVIADSDVLSDTTITPDLFSPTDKSVSLSPGSSASGSDSINFGSESTDRKQSSTDLKLKSTDLRQESLAHESEHFDLLPESSDLMSEDNDLKSDSFGLKSEFIEPIPESFAINYNSAFSKPESAILTPETIDLISDSSHSKSESITILPESDDSESYSLLSKPVDLDHGSTIIKTGPENLPPESSNNNFDSASPKQESFKGGEQMPQDSAMDAGLFAGRGLLSPVIENRGHADGVDVTVNRTNSDIIQPVVDHREPALDDSRTKHSPESKEELIGVPGSSSQSQEVEMVEETEQIETPSSPTLLLPQAILKQYCHHSRDDLIQVVLDQQRQLREKEAHIHDLENYIDNLLAKVLDVQPRILGASDENPAQGPQSSSKSSGKSSLPSQPANVHTPKATETYVAYQKVTKETAGPDQVTMVTSPKPATKKPGFLNVLKVKK